MWPSAARVSGVHGSLLQCAQTLIEPERQGLLRTAACGPTCHCRHDPSPAVRTLCATQWAAVQAGAEAAAAAAAAAPDRSAGGIISMQNACRAVATSLVALADVWPSLVTVSFLQPIRTALEPFLQVSTAVSKPVRRHAAACLALACLRLALGLPCTLCSCLIRPRARLPCAGCIRPALPGQCAASHRPAGGIWRPAADPLVCSHWAALPDAALCRVTLKQQGIQDV